MSEQHGTQVSATPLPADTDVLVVGAGPVGLTLAAELARRGADAVLIDRQAEGANTSRAAVVHARTLEVLEGIGAAPELVDQGVAVPRFTVRDRDRALLTIGFGGLPTAYPYTLMIPQNRTEEILAGRLRAAGGRVHRPHEVARLAQDDDGVTVTTTGGETIRARYVVGADGMHSTVREQAGIGFTGDTYAQSFVLADVRLDWKLRSDEVMLYFSPAGLLVVAPLPDGRHRIVATVDDAPAHPTAADVQALLDERGPARRPARGRRGRVELPVPRPPPARRPVPQRPRPAGRGRRPRAQPGGRPGHEHRVQDAVALAARLAAVLDGTADAASLERLRGRAPARRRGRVTFTHRMTGIATARARRRRRARNALLRALDRVPAVHRAMAMNLSELAVDPARR
nr:FAD-dependent oxidoreductase [Actinomadura sp. CNU-125]